MKTLRLQDIEAITPSQRSILAKHGFSSAVELCAYAQIYESNKALRRALELTEAKFDQLVDNLRGTVDPRAFQVPMTISTGRLGFTPTQPKWTDRAGTLEKAADRQIQKHGGLPEKVILVDDFPEVKDQGLRGTCVAHGCLAAQEYLLKGSLDLSEQFLYWNCKQHDGLPGPGTYLSTAVDCLMRDGVCTENVWPYNPEPGPSEGQGPPPSAALEEAKEWSIENHEWCLPDVEVLKALLAYGHDGRSVPIAFGFGVFAGFGNAETSRTGKVFMPFSGEERLGGHCVCLAGYSDDPDWPGGGYFVFRNSWGSAWAHESPVKAGYGMLPYAYVDQHGSNFVILNVGRSQTLFAPVPHRQTASWGGLAAGLLIGCLLIGTLGSVSQSDRIPQRGRPVAKKISRTNRSTESPAGAHYRATNVTTVRQILKRIMRAIQILRNGK